jgi:hypothetical protein
MSTTVEGSLYFYPMTDDPAATMLAARSEGSDCAFKAVEYMRVTRYDDFKGLVVFIAAYFTLCHACHSFL